MRFVTEAGRLGFVFQKESGDFLLDDWTKVAKLADESLRLWEHSFEIEYGGDAHLLKHGQRTLSWEIEARSRDDEKYDPAGKLSYWQPETRHSSYSACYQGKAWCYFYMWLWFGKTRSRSSRRFRMVAAEPGRCKAARWPRYMLFSLFARKYLKQDRRAA